MAEDLSVVEVAPSREEIDRRVGQTDYGRLRRGGYPLGSGGMESANK